MAKKTPETQAKDRVKACIERICETRGFKHRGTWNAGSTFGVATLDYIGVIAGHPVVIEVKRFDGGGKLTARQKMDLDEYAAAGANAFVIDSDTTLANFRGWLTFLSQRVPVPHP